MANQQKILIFCEEFHEDFVTGPQKRKFQLYNLLKEDYQVTLAISGTLPDDSKGRNLLSIQDPKFKKQLPQYHYLVINPQTYVLCPYIDQIQAILIVDLYIPSIIEHQFTFLEDPKQQLHQFHLDQSIYYKTFSKADLFLCATQSQVHFYRGMMSAMGLMVQEQSLLKLPFYACKSPFKKVTNFQKKIAWIGGFWNWFLPEPFLEQIPDILKMHSELEIHFVGISHPFAKFPQNERAVLEVERLKKAYPQNIFSHAWMKSEDYLELLTDLDAVVLLSKYEVEEQYSIRTRLFEILESKIPVILNSKDHLSNLIQEFQLGHQISHLDSVKFPELIQQVLHSNHSRNWEAFFTEFNKNRLKSNLLESIATLKKKNKVNLKNPYLQIRLHSFHKLLWKVQKLKKLTYSELCNKVISKLKRRFK